MKTSIQKALLDSHIVAMAIAVLLLWSLDSAVHVLDVLWLPLTDYLANAISSHSFPSSPHSMSHDVRLSFTLLYVFAATSEAASAWVLSKWAFGLTPLRALANTSARLAHGRNDD